MHQEKKVKKKRRQLPVRLNMLFFFVFLLFFVLVLRLGFIQIVYGEDFRREIERTEAVTINHPVPRGRMYDRNFKMIVDNAPQKAIAYINQGHGPKEMLQIAEKLASIIKMDSKSVSDRDKREFWLLRFPDEALKKVSEKERKTLKKGLTNQEWNKKVYQLTMERITEEEINEFSEGDLEIISIWKELRNSTEFTPQVIKNKDVSDKEFAEVSESLQSLPGVETVTDWERVYKFNNTLKTVIGKVTDTKEGIPRDHLDYYIAREYNRNDRVGKSYIEWQYEDVLSGQKSKIKKVTNKAGEIVESETISEGEQGNDLVLSIDMKLQLAVEKIIEQVLLNTKKMKDTEFLDRAFVVLMDPRTGEILTMAGKLLVTDEDGNVETEDFSLGNITTSYNVGSTVKGATILTGFQQGVLKPRTVQMDAPMKIKGTPVKKSWQNFGPIDEVYALRRSSNVYMFHTAIKIGKGRYDYDKPLILDPGTFSTVRDSFGQFGLGTRTGIDLPNETIGFKGTSTKPGFLLDLVIGQYDTYTPMQLAQYISTIANGGNRLQPRMVKEIRKTNLQQVNEPGALIREIKPKILNRVDVNEEYMKRVQEGFRQVMQHPLGTAYKEFKDAPYSPAGKTGTAEAFYDGPFRHLYKEPPPVMNLSLVAYAPSKNPEISVAVVVPWVYTGEKGPSPNLEIGRKVLDTYFDLKKQNNTYAQ
jgi:penicillin-binding protein A